MTPRRVLHVITGLEVGGAETLLLETVVRQRRLGWQPAVVCLRRGRLVPQFRHEGISCESLDAGKGDPRMLFSLRGWLRKFGPQVVHAHLFEAEIVAALALLGRANVCLVTTRHNTEGFRPRRLQRAANRFSSQRSDVIVAISGAVADFWRSRDPGSSGKLRVVRSGVDVTRFAPSPEARRRVRAGWILGEAPVVGSVGRLTEEKGHEYLLRAWPAVLATFPKAVLVIVGEGPLRGRLEGLASALGLQSSVRFLGRRFEELPGILAALDLFAMPSVYEGLGIALVEALATGVPAVASDVEGIPEILSPAAGVLVPSKDPGALAGAIIQLLSDPRKRQQMGQEGRRRAEQEFDIERTVERLLEAYEWALSRRALGRQP